MPDTFSRVNYFTGQFLTANDFRDEQEYCRRKLMRHNRALHGSGIVYGLELSQQGESIIVQPGLALDCAGQEIELPTVQVADPPDDIRDLYVVIAYREFADAMVAVVGGPTDVPGETTQPARIVESFELSFTPQVPPCGRKPGEVQPLTCGQAHPVVLGQVLRRRGKWQLSRAYRRLMVGEPVKGD